MSAQLETTPKDLFALRVGMIGRLGEAEDSADGLPSLSEVSAKMFQRGNREMRRIWRRLARHPWMAERFDEDRLRTLRRRHMAPLFGYEGAKPYLLKASRLLGDCIKAKNKICMEDLSAYRRWRVRRGRRHLEAGMRISPFHPHGLFLLGVVAKAEGRYREALSLCAQANAIVPAELLIAGEALRLALFINEPASAITVWERTLKALPNESKVAADASVCHLLAGNLSRAHELASKSLQLDPDDSVARIVKTLLRKIEERLVDPPQTWEAYQRLVQEFA